MALTNIQLQQRIETIEDKLNEIQVAMNNLTTRKVLNAAVGLKQQEIEALKDRVTALESQIAILQSE